MNLSTRGYLTIVDEQKNIQMAAFYPHDAYPSHLGLHVLQAIQSCAFAQFIDDLHEKYPEELDMVSGIRRDWYVRNATNKDGHFFDYAYELCGPTQELHVFHYGDHALTIPYDQIPFYQFIFEHEEGLYYPLCLDERTMTLKKDFYKEIRDMVKDGAGAEDFQALLEQNPSVIYMDSGRIRDYWSTTSDSFHKYVRTSNGGKLDFYMDKSLGHFRIDIQTPFIRAPITYSPIYSAAAAEKQLAELIRDRTDDVHATIRIFKELETYSKTVKAIFANDNESMDDRADKAQEHKLDMLARLKAVQAEHKIFGDTNGLLEREVNEVCFRNYRQAHARMEAQRQTTSLSDTLKDAAQRAEPSPGNRSKAEPVHLPHER